MKIFLSYFKLFLYQGRHINDIVKEMYFKAEGHRFYGVYFLGNPSFTIRDPELLRRILVKDFDHFVDRQKNVFAEVSRSKTDEVIFCSVCLSVHLFICPSIPSCVHPFVPLSLLMSIYLRGQVIGGKIFQPQLFICPWNFF